jgi:excisionase family DNA binding protein
MGQVMKPWSQAPSEKSPRFYSVAEAARMFQTSQMTLYRAIAEGQFPAVRIRGRLIIPVVAVERMIEAALGGNCAVDAADFVGEGAA